MRSLHEDGRALTNSFRDDDVELERLLGVAFVFHKDTNSGLLKALRSQGHLLLQALDFLVQSFKLVRNRIVEVSGKLQQTAHLLSHVVYTSEVRVELRVRGMRSSESKLAGHRGK